MYVCIEALLHEAIHQYLYQTELEHGNFCDLSDVRTYRSPWSGNRIPLHSLVHAAFVWFGLLRMWCQLLESIPDGDEALLVRDKIARRLLGYTFIQEIIDSPAFPAGSVEPEIRELIGRMAQITQASGGLADGHCTLFDALQFREGGAW